MIESQLELAATAWVLASYVPVRRGELALAAQHVHATALRGFDKACRTMMPNARKQSCLGAISAPFPPTVPDRLLLSALAAAIE